MLRAIVVRDFSRSESFPWPITGNAFNSQLFIIFEWLLKRVAGILDDGVMPEGDDSFDNTNQDPHHGGGDALAEASTFQLNEEKNKQEQDQTPDQDDEASPRRNLGAGQNNSSLIARMSERVFIGVVVGLIVVALVALLYAIGSRFPAFAEGLRDSAVNKLVPNTQRPSIRLGFEQNSVEPPPGTFDGIGYEWVVLIAPLTQTAFVRCHVKAALGDLAGDKDIAQEHYWSIITDEECTDVDKGRAYFNIGNIFVIRAIRQNNDAMFRSANESYEDAIPRLEGKAEERALLHVIMINQGFIVLNHHDARLGSDDLAKVAGRVFKVATALTKPNSPDEEYIKNNALILMQKLQETKTAEERVKTVIGNLTSKNIRAIPGHENDGHNFAGQPPPLFTAIW
jgi:hypothetical protein